MEFYFANVCLSITSSADIKFTPFAAQHFIKPITPTTHTFVGKVEWMPQQLLNNFELSFTGKAFGDIEFPYQWHIHHHNEEMAIELIFEEHKLFKRTVAIISPSKRTLDIFLEPHEALHLPIEFDPIEHPLSSLLLVYLAHLSGGFLVHASGVVDADKGHLFTAVSGTGKSTMAALWKNADATIINDDRLWLVPINGKWHMFNTPMVWYADYPRMAPLNAVYLLHQSPENKLKKLSGVTASMRFLSNCIQHFYNPKITDSHLDLVLEMAKYTPIYDLGFKPNHEVVELIRNEFNHQT